MKLYFLVEGVSSEMQVYPQWINYFIPSLEHVNNYECFKNSHSGYFFVSGEGYPSILNHLENSLKDIAEINDVDYFFVILDCDESSIEEREGEVYSVISKLNFPVKTEVNVIVQMRCFETILLGNIKLFQDSPTVTL